MAENRRITLCVEGVPTIDGRLIEPGALTWDDVLPVQGDWRDDGGPLLLGSVVHIRREDDGRITGETDVPWQVGQSMHVTVARGEFKQDAHDFLRVSGGNIVGLALTHGGWGWPNVPQEES